MVHCQTGLINKGPFKIQNDAKGDSLCGCDVHVGGCQHVLKLAETCNLSILANISRQFISLLFFSRNSDTSITVLLRRHWLLFKKTAHSGWPGIMRLASFGNTRVMPQVLTPHSKHVSHKECVCF